MSFFLTSLSMGFSSRLVWTLHQVSARVTSVVGTTAATVVARPGPLAWWSDRPCFEPGSPRETSNLASLASVPPSLK